MPHYSKLPSSDKMGLIQLLVLFGTVLLEAHAAPSANVVSKAGIHFQKRQGQLPILKLPYQSFQATKYDPKTDVIIKFIYTA